MLNTLTMNRYKKWMRSQWSTSSTCQNGMEPGRRIHALLGITNYQCIHHLEKHLSQRLMFSCRKMTPQSWRWTSPPPLTPILEALFWKRLITSLFQPGACHRQLMTVTSFVVAWNRHLLAALSRSSFHPKSAAVSGFSSAVSSRQLIFHSSRITRSSRRHLRPQDLIIFWWPPKSYMSSALAPTQQGFRLTKRRILVKCLAAYTVMMVLKTTGIRPLLQILTQKGTRFSGVTKISVSSLGLSLQATCWVLRLKDSSVETCSISATS